MKAHFIVPSDPISPSGFLATPRIACETNRIHEKAAMRVLPFFVKNALASPSNSCMSAATNTAPKVAFAQSAEPIKQKKLLLPYPVVDNYLLKNFATHQTVAKMNSTILRHTQPSSMSQTQNAVDLYVKSCKAADVYDGSTLNDIFIEGVDFSICHSHGKCWVSNPQAELSDIAFKTQPLLVIQK